MTTYAYLGPQGTFAEAALRALPDAAHASWSPYATVSETLEAVRAGVCSTAVVPLENSVRGVVPATLDELASGGTGLHIAAEIEIPVTFALMARPGTTLDEVRRVRSHPHAHGQCRGWLSARLPQAQVLLSTSTAGAAREVGESPQPGDAAIAAPVAAERYGLTVLASGIGERADAVTRFVALRSAGPAPAPTGRDRSSFLLPAEEAGARTIAEILGAFSEQGVGPTWVQSWPSGNRLGSYHFFVDIDGHIEDDDVGEVVMALHRKGIAARFLGSYLRAGAGPRARVPAPRRGEEGGLSAECWLEALRSGGGVVAA
ncbi:prephenate dehydratase [Kitasatospora camelliae]|uniref:prephenate dehydratase n=1 Tax=Kitasatospora camelliae TaxID=3156397 RepID=A0AAU8JU87_9ACTN